MRKFRNVAVILAVVMVLAAMCSAASAENVSDAMKKLQDRLAAQEQRIAEQDKRISELETQRNESMAAQDKNIGELRSVELSPQEKREFRSMYNQVKAQADTKPILPKWTTDLDLFADLRLRYHYETFDGSTARDVNKGRFRLRVGAKKTWFDKQLEAGFRLASGSSDDPSSTNQSFDTNFSEKDVWIDQAYAKYKPDAIKGLELVGGKMKNPLFCTNILWDSDVNPEGLWAKYTFPTEGIQPFVGVGWFQSDENSSSVDGNLLAYQAGLIIHLNDNTKWTTAGTYYDWQNYEVTFDRAGGNTMAGGRLAAEEFDVVNITSKLSTKVGKVPVSVWGDWAQNTKNALDDGTDDAWGVGVKVGQNKKKGDLSAKYKYAYIEANASPGAFNDSDFGHSNSKGHQVGVTYSLADFMTTGVSLHFTEPVSGSMSYDSRFLALFDVILSWK